MAMCGPPYVVRRRRSPECLWQRMKVELNGGGEERVLALSGHADFIGSARRSIPPPGDTAHFMLLSHQHMAGTARVHAHRSARFQRAFRIPAKQRSWPHCWRGHHVLLGLDDSGKRSWAGWQWLKRVSLEANVDVPLCGGCASCPRPSSLVGPQFLCMPSVHDGGRDWRLHAHYFACASPANEFHAREGRLWFDKACLEKDKAEVSLLLLPIFLAGCTGRCSPSQAHLCRASMVPQGDSPC